MKLDEIRTVPNPNPVTMPGPGDPETSPAAFRQAGLLGGKPIRKPSAPDDSESSSEFEDRLNKERAVRAQQRYNEEWVDEQGDSPNTNQRYNTLLNIDAETAPIAEQRLKVFREMHWGAKNVVDTEFSTSPDPKRPVRLQVYILDRHKHGYEKA